MRSARARTVLTKCCRAVRSFRSPEPVSPPENTEAALSGQFLSLPAKQAPSVGAIRRSRPDLGLLTVGASKSYARQGARGEQCRQSIEHYIQRGTRASTIGA